MRRIQNNNTNKMHGEIKTKQIESIADERTDGRTDGRDILAEVYCILLH